MEKLVPVSEALNRTLTVGEVYREIGFGAVSLAGVDQVAVYVRNPDDTVSCPWSHGLSQEYVQSVLSQVHEVPGGQMLTRAQTIQIEDIQALPDGHVLKPLARQQEYRALALWPLIFEGRVIAAVGCYYPQPHAWSETEQEVMDAFARQAAVALENARLFEAEHRRSAELEALRQASLRLTSSLELQPVLSDILDQALRLISADDAHIFLYDGERLHFGTAMWAGGRQQKPYSEPRRTGLTYTVARTGERVVAPDVNHHPLFQDYQWGGAIVSLPLVKSGKVRGVMNVAFDKPYHFAEEELRVLELLADQAGIAIENARLFQALEARVAELSVIADASAALREAANVQEIGQMIATQTTKLVQADAALLSLVDDSNRWLVPIGMVGLPAEIMECEHSVAEGFSRQVLRTRQAFHSKDLESEPLAAPCKELLAGMGPALCVPLRTSAEQVVGTLLAARSKQAKEPPPLYESQAERLLYTLAEIAGNAIQRAHAFEALEVAYLETVLSLAKAMDARDSYTNDHSQRLAVWAEEIALELECQDDEIQSILWAALLHDIGKIGVPDHILRKPGPLTDEEWVIMKLHPVAGAEIVSPVKSLEDVAPLIRAHQERFDGQGYPDGLSGEDIPLGARILAVVDAYSAITDDRVYRKARSHEEAIEELQRCAGTQFDPGVVEVFIRVIETRGRPVLSGEPPARRAIRARTTGSLKLKGGRHPDDSA
jgi:putative nucleotidyltransferase with HDIG domain